MTALEAPARNATSVPLAPLLADRWSPRGFATDHELSDDELTSLLEAARWAPSCNNQQPWRLALARRGTPLFDDIAATLMDFNRAWMPRVSALIVLVAETERDGKPLAYAEYDTGQAAAHLSIQAAHLGLWSHQVAGFEKDQVSERFGLAAHQLPLTIIGVGLHSDAEDVPERARERDASPRERRALEQILLEPLA